MLQHANHRVPVTAIARTISDVILVSYGNCLAAVNETTKQIKHLAKIFDDQTIHGIVFDDVERLAIVWGGPWIAGVHVGIDVGNEIVEIELLNCCKSIDWIFSIGISPASSDQRLLAAVTAHNALLVFGVKDLRDRERLSQSMIQPLVPGTNCILYSAHLVWSDEYSCLVASGTSFGKIIVWSCTVAAVDDTRMGRELIHYDFVAHEGSVYDVQISSAVEITGLGSNRRILASCSDDRTVRLWDITGFGSRSLSLDAYHGETGFGSRDTCSQDAPLCSARQMGHISRIWRVRFAMHRESLEIISFGEDAHSITWRVVANPIDHETARLCSLEQVNVRHAHTGKHIWAVDVTHGRSVLTGGADGAVAIEDSYQSTSSSRWKLDQSLVDVLERGDRPKAFALVHNGPLVSTTVSGSVMCVEWDADQTITTRHLARNLPGLGGYSIAVHHDGCVLFAGIGASVYLAYDQAKKIKPLCETSGKVAGLFLSTSENRHEPMRYLLVTTIGSSTGRLHRILEDELDKTWTVTESRDIALPQGIVVTSFVTLKFNDQFMAAFGFRNGSIILHDTTKDIETSSVIALPRTHGREAVTSLQNIDNYIYSTGRDGTFAIHRPINHAHGGVRLETVHQSTLPFGRNIEGLCMTTDQHIWTWGFKSNNFTVFDATTQCEVMSVDCAGYQGEWSYQPCPVGGTLVWKQKSEMFAYQQSRLPFESINAGGHGREIKATAILDGTHQIIATGAEDTNIKLHTLGDQNGFGCEATIRQHNTGIQHLQWYSSDKDDHDGNRPPIFLFSSAGVEEFYIWRITRGVPGVGIGYVCEASHPRSGQSDLRIMNFDAQKIETAPGFRITMLYSDSTIKRWVYDDTQWTLLASGDYITFCLTQVIPINADLLVTASTDGHLAFWDERSSKATDRMTWQHRWPIHQSAVLSATAHGLSDGSTLIVTGGDDNALALTRLPKRANAANMGDSDERTKVVRRPHAAAITGLAVVQVEPSRLWLFSASLDQRLKGWEISLDLDRDDLVGATVQLRANVPTAVADVSGLTLCRLADGSRGILVCGVGMDIWKIDEERMLEQFEPLQE